MTGAVGPGDLLEYVGHPRCDTGPFTVGSIYTCNELTPAGYCSCGVYHDAGLIFKDIANPKPDFYGWCPDMFRPISRRSDFEAVLKTLKTPAPSSPVVPVAPTRTPVRA